MSSLPVDGLLFIARHGAGKPGLELAPLGLQVLAALPRLVHLLLQFPHLHQTKPSGQKTNAGHCCSAQGPKVRPQNNVELKYYKEILLEITGKGTKILLYFY